VDGREENARSELTEEGDAERNGERDCDGADEHDHERDTRAERGTRTQLDTACGRRCRPCSSTTASVT
jgi:hypothetical protein